MKKTDIPGGPAKARRKRRQPDVERFVASGDEAWKVEIDEDEFVPNVYSAYTNAIKKRPYLAARCYVVCKHGEIYLVRK